MNKFLPFFFILLLPLLTQANGSGNWQCTARDGANKEWVKSSNYERIAINLAFEACKKESTLPTTCKTAKEECEAFIDGQSTRPMWRCIALDQMGKAWESNVYTQRDDAAIAAKDYCHDRSGFPDTCYINLMTCRNMNSRD